MPSNISKDSPIILVGAGAFGLSNALHLSENGYSNITVFDRLNFEANKYTLLQGADTASADINKAFRAQYAEKKHYQDLAFLAFEVWQKWDKEIGLLPDDEAAKYTRLKLIDLCGWLRLDDIDGWEEQASKESYDSEGLGSLRYDINNPDDIKRAKAAGYGLKIDLALDYKRNGTVPGLTGAFDSTAGQLYASRALQYVMYLCELKGVKFVLGGNKGTFKDYIYNDDSKETVVGVVTKDGKSHHADLVVINCGPWSTELIPELDGINEATSGNILIAKVPDDRKDLKVKYSPEHFPIFSWKNGHSREHEHSGFIFPLVEPEGYLKIGIRQTKYTNPVKLDNGRVVSIPKTSNSDPPFTLLTKHIVNQAKEFLQTFFPDLLELDWESRILWYTDTINNDYIYDFVPKKSGLFVACGGSGHAFKMLPVLGQFLVDKLEGRENFYTELFSWNSHENFDKDPNGLKEGLNGPRVYDKQVLSVKDDYKFA
ncbi:unnamed protein product [Ambrosiozyma monospora]|uniref:Unnamed protein product n=1 Tax=Ambrosiozyma monospora TaxID=43982 RepID=A0ACB5T607_AMBMO|nr:unnamed protein product [Ambrosiozyma monospora]